jgi:transglutaminase-like putative cysteine protease
MTQAATQALPLTRRPGARRTLLALLACALGAFPLKALLDDTRWLGEAWLAMAVVMAPAVLLRLRRAPSALDIWPGVVLLIPWLTRIYVPHHAWHGFIPTRTTFSDVGNLMDSLHHTTSDEVAPIHSTVAIRLVISALLGLLAALIDLIAVVGRRGALAGVPLLVVYTVSGAVPREPVAWFWFAIAAVGYLILLSLDAADDLQDWGRRVSRTGADRSRLGLAFSGQRIGVIAVVAAVALPLLVPANARNLLSDMFHHHNGSGGVGTIGAGGSSSISPYVALKGQLERDKPVSLMSVHIDSGGAGAVPFYAKVNVLDNFTGDGWRPGDHGTVEPIGATSYGSDPASGQPQTVGYQATITIDGLGGNPPVFSTPTTIGGLDARTDWSRQDGLLLDSDMSSGMKFTEVVAQPNPTIAQLQAPATTVQPDMSHWLQLPPLPAYVNDLVSRLTAGASTSYDKAQAIFQFFSDPANHFVYSLETAKGDSGSDLVDFLQHRRGFCQQYAGAMGVMLRAAGVPARIVLGYMHAAPDKNGDFGITTFDAHSWVEAFFPGAGWIPFDPTPVAGLVGGKTTDLAWAKHSYGNDGGPAGPTTSVNSSPTNRPSASEPGGSGGNAGSSGGTTSIDWSLIVTGLVIVALIGLALIPAAVRWSRRRTRLGAARRGNADALWAELSDTAVDLGYVWSDARSPRQVAAWLANDVGDTAPALAALATAVEHGRYSRDARAENADELSDGLLAVSDQLWSRRSGRVRFMARFWPASLGWGGRMSAARSALRRTH